jgi:N-alpha-acetyl-L-2,4-diaminobutyrate deacetylase
METSSMTPTTRVALPPDQIDLDTTGRRDYWVTLEHDGDWADWRIPLTVIVGDRARPREGVVAFGSTHGNEYEGPVAIRHLCHEIDAGAVAGRLILVPVLNPAAFAAGTRDGAGVNLNRAFVDGAGIDPALSSIGHRIARFVREKIWPHVHVVLDLHAGGTVARFAPMTSFHAVPDPAQEAATIDAARRFGTPFVARYQDRTPGLLTSEAEGLGKITVGCELGWGAAVSPRGVEHARRGVLAAAVRYAGLDLPVAGDDVDDAQTLLEMIDPACFIPAPWPGWYEPLHECGAAVAAGDPIGYLHDFDRIDEPPRTITATVSGYLVAQAWLAKVTAGQHIAVVGESVPWRGPQGSGRRR